MSLIEVLAATVLGSMAVALLLGYLVYSQRVRKNAEIRRQAVLAAHSQCLRFSDRAIYVEADTWDAGRNETFTSTSVPDLAGGVPVVSRTEVVTVSPSGDFAQIKVSLTVETVSEQPTTVEAYGIRFR